MDKIFTNEQIDLGQLPDFEQVTLTKPHPDYWIVITINLLLWMLALGGCIAALSFIDPDIKVYIHIIAMVYLVFAILLFIIYRLSFKKRGYALREKDLIYKSGIIAETTTIVPLNRIQHVALNESFFSRMFKLGKLQVYTAGGSSGHLGIAGIEIGQAKHMKELLLNKIDEMNTSSE